MSESIPNEHLTGATTYSISGHCATRLNGNLQAPRSLDPFYEIFDDVGPFPGATAFHHAQRMATSGRHAMPAVYRRAATTFDPADQTPARLAAAVNLLGAVASYGAITNNQAATFGGGPTAADPRSDLVANLFAAGLIDIASPYLRRGIGTAADGTVGYQLGNRKAVGRLLLRLTVAEATAISGGRPLPTAPVHIRHDILGADLALTCASYLHIGTVLGPHFSTFPDLTAACPYPSSAKGGPDLTLIRADGLRIAVEITSSLNKRFSDKVENWMRVLSAAPFETSGLVVIFVAAPSPAMRLRHGDRVRRGIYKAVRSAAKKHPGSMRDRTADRVGVATWREWFPGPLQASERFGWLEVDRPNGKDDLWQRCRVGDPRDLPLAESSRVDLRSVISAASLLSQTPFWLREQHQPAALSADLLRTAVGKPEDVDPLRAGASRRVTGAPQGIARSTCIPVRLVGPADRPDRAARQRVAGPTVLPSQPPSALQFGHKLAGREKDAT